MNTKEQTFNIVALLFSSITATLHVIFFVAESVLWLQPYIYENILAKSNSVAGIGLYEQAKIMEVVFFNQGFYNLFVAFGGIAGIIFIKRGKFDAGIALVSYSCLFAVGAGLVLAFSSGAYLGAIVQAVPPMIALIAIYFGLKGEE